MKQFKSWLSLFLWVAFPCSLLAQQVDWSRTKAESKTTSTPTAQPEDNAKPQSESRPATPSRPVVGSNFSNPRTVRPSTPIDQWTGNRAVEIDVSQPSGTWDTLENPPQLQTEFIPQNLAASSNADLTISPASSADEAPALRSRARTSTILTSPDTFEKNCKNLEWPRSPIP